MIKGKVKLDFCDALTGKVKERIEGNNSFTNAIDSLLNKCPFGWDRATMDGNKYSFVNQLNFATTALGGVLIFPDEVTAGANALYEPLTHQPTAYSRYGGRDTSDTKSGSYNILESTDISGGFRFVHEWGASYGNGTIKTVCLTNDLGGQTYRKEGCWWRDFYVTHIGDRYGDVLGYCDGYIYYYDSSERLNDGETLKRMKRPMAEMLVNQKSMDVSRSNAEEIWTNNTGDAVKIGLDSIGKKVYIVYGATNSNKTLLTIDVSGSSFTPVSSTLQNTSGVVTNVGNNNNMLVKRGDYLYFYKSKSQYSATDAIVFKINLTNNADYDEISLPSSAVVERYYNMFLLTDTNEICGGSYVIDTNDDVHILDMSRWNTSIYGMDRYGVWQLNKRTGSSGESKLLLSIDPCYMASKFVLDSAYTKTSSLTMKLVYEVTHT